MNAGLLKAKPIELFSAKVEKKQDVIKSVETLAPAISQEKQDFIQVQELNLLELDSVGLYDEAPRSFSSSMWEDTSRGFVDSLTQKTKVFKNSKTANTILKRMLLTSVELPKEKSKHESGWLFSQRIKMLFDMGEHENVLKLFDAASIENLSPELQKIKIDSLLLSKKYEKACEYASKSLEQKSDSLYLNQVFNFCLYQKGEKDKAFLGVSLLKEEGLEDEDYIDIFNVFSGEKEKFEKPFEDLTALSFSLLSQEKGKKYDVKLSKKTPLWLLKSLAVSKNAPIELKIMAGEMAQKAGVISQSALRSIYREFSPTKEMNKKPLSWAKENYGQKARALLFLQAEKIKEPLKKIEVISKALDMAEKDQGDLYLTQARAFSSLILDIKPADENVWFAYHAIKSLLISGYKDKALLWFDLAKRYEKSNDEALRAVCTSAPLFNIAKGQSIVVLTNPWFEKTKANMKKFGKSDVQIGNHIEKTLGIYQSFGTKMRYSDLLNTLDSNFVESCVAPKSSVVNFMHQAREDEKIGEILSLILISLGSDFPNNTCQTTLNSAVETLLEIGMRKEASALAMEYFLQ
jgi:hypothetical protein